MAGTSLADIADLMGHKDLATTRIYAKVEQTQIDCKQAIAPGFGSGDPQSHFFGKSEK